MGQCLGVGHKSSSQITQRSHKEIELHLREDQTFKQRVFFTGSRECIANLFSRIDGSKSMQRIANCAPLLVFGYIRAMGGDDTALQIPHDIQLLCLQFYGKYEFPNHYELPFYPHHQWQQLNDAYSSTNSTNSTPTVSSIYDDSPSSPTELTSYPAIPIAVSSDSAEEHVQSGTDTNAFAHFASFPSMFGASRKPHTSPLLITYHSLQCFQKKDYYLKWIHLLDDSLSVVFVADLAQIRMHDETKDSLLLRDMERFRRLMYYSNIKYDAKLPILIISGINEFNTCLKEERYRTKFESQFPEFEFDEDANLEYDEQALQHVKQEYKSIFDSNLRIGVHGHRRSCAQNLFIRTINDVHDMMEVQTVWLRVNNTIIHGNIMHELRNGGIAM